MEAQNSTSGVGAAVGVAVTVTGGQVQIGQLRLYERCWEIKPKEDAEPHTALIYLCHGYAEHCGYYQQLAEGLAAANYIVVGLDLYGHGLSEGDVNRVKSFDTFVEHCAGHLTKLRLDFPQLTVHGIGYSMGALILHRLSARHPQLVTGCMIWLSPALQPAGLKLTRRRVQFCRQLLQRLPNLPLPGGKFLPEDLTRSKEMRDQIIRDANIKQRNLYTRFCSIMLEAMLQTTPDGLTAPTLIAVGTADKIADPSCTLAFVEAAQSMGKSVSVRVYHGGMHQLHTDLPAVGVQLHQELLQWISMVQQHHQ